MIGPQLPFSESLHQEKYRGKGESFKESMNRVAGALSDSDEHFHWFRDTLLPMRFMPAGRVQAAIGSTRNTTPYNCFVSGTIEDSYVHGHGSIMARAQEAATTMRMGGGIGYDFSTLRPNGDLIRKLKSHSSGPISFMRIFDAVCTCTSSSGHRRGAQMGVLRVDHPDIEEFIHAKQPPKEAEPILEMLEQLDPTSPDYARWYETLQQVFRLTGFNVSIAITDEFMEAVQGNKPFMLRFGGQEYREINALSLWDTIMRSTWDYAEPGVLFIDQINRMNNLYYCETIAATNPCFTGDTKVWTAEHGHMPFKSLIGQDVDVLTQSGDGRLVYRTMKNIRKTQENAQLVEVYLDNGTSVRCTPQHQFFLKDGRVVEACMLTCGDSVSSVYRYNANQKGYKRLTNSLHQPLEHHVPFEDLDSQTNDVHHCNEIKDDNRPSNLQVMDKTQHTKLHKCGDNNPMHTHPHRNPMVLNPDCLKGSKNGRWRNDLNTQTMLDLRSQGQSFQAIANQCGCSKSTIQQRVKQANHRIVRVEWLDEREDVYCGTVDDPTHRFFVALGDDDGVLVANCAEQPLPPFGACLLGSFNLVKYLEKNGDAHTFNWGQFEADIPVVVRAMDNVVDRAVYPLYEQEKEARSKRRMGLGVTGLANTIEAIGFPYGTPGFLLLEDKILGTLNRLCYRASALLAKEKGSFPLYRETEYLAGKFIRTLDDETRGLIQKHGIRNSHLTSIAPTGTISMTADNVSSGVEPVFAYKQKRLVHMPGGQVETDFDDYGVRVLGVAGKRCSDVTAEEHLAVLTTAYQHVDSAVSKTCNVSPTMPWSDFKALYVQAWENGCKGCTTFQVGGKRAGILKSADDDDGKEQKEPATACFTDPETGRHECE